jgi:23S rRNA (uracil1939-C5)-methyltransferase
LRHGKENTDKVVFHQIKVIDAVKGVSVAKAPDGKVVFIPNVVPDVIDADL